MKKLWLAIVLALLLGFALRVLKLDDNAVWWDEAWSVWVAQQPFDQTTYLTAADVHPPAYQWALHIWARLTGISMFAARYLSLLWSMVTLALIYALARRLGGARAALWALFFASAAAFLIHWAQETRMYAQAGALTALTAYLYTRALMPAAHEKPAPRLWIALGISAGALALTHYLGALVSVILALHYLITFKRRARDDHKRAFGAALIAGAMIAAWMLYALPLTRSGSAGGDANPALVFQLSATLLATGTSIDLQVYLLPALLVTFGGVIGIAFYGVRRPSGALLVLLFALVPPLVIYTLGVLQTRFYAPKPEERYLIIFAPVIYGGIGLALDALYRRGRLIGLGAALLLTVFYGAALLRDFDARYLRDDYATMFDTLHALARPDEPVIFTSGDRYPLVRYHLNRAAGGQTPLTVRDLPPFEAGGAENIAARAGDAPRLWLVEIERHFQDAEGDYRAALDAGYTRAFHAEFEHNAITLYTRDESTPPTSDADVLPPIREARAGDVIRAGSAGGVSITCGGQTLAQAPAGWWTLVQARIYPAYPDSLCEVQAGDESAQVRLTRVQGTPPTPSQMLNADFGPLTLVGYDIIRSEVPRGQAFEITLTWRANALHDANYTVFAQLIGPFKDDGPVWSSADGWPANTPTSRLWQGLTFRETRRLNVPPDMPPGLYEVYIGLYQLESGERLTLPDGTDYVTIPALRVTP